jgi:putative membrane protein insertion efficiency factor|tara:strand:+ start:1821 stop:2192 length:372 start_codon:yes stop_codon:yes gene_type:complete
MEEVGFVNKDMLENTDTKFEFNVDPKDTIIVERAFKKHTKMDLEIQNLSIPKKPFWLNITLRMLRFYQNNISEKLGNRCVFDPSCSRYSELAYRKKGFFKGTLLTLKRLHRCKPKNGGIDILK